MNRNELVFVDLDHTLLRVDSLYSFIKRHYNFTIIGYSILRKLRLITKKRFCAVLTDQCEHVLTEEQLESFSKLLSQEKNMEIFDLVNKKKMEGAKIVVVSSSPHVYVTLLANKFRFVGWGSHFNSQKEFIFLEGLEKFKIIQKNFSRNKYHYKLGISDNATDLIFSSKFENWIKV